MGTVLRALATGGGRGAEGLATFDARFRRLLACDSATEVCDHLAGVLRAAERNAVAVNFARLFYDLQTWGDRVKVRWATQYWGMPAEESSGFSSALPEPPEDAEEGER